MIDADRLISLDGAWEFQHDPAGSLSPAELGPMRAIRVPGPWQARLDDLHLTSGIAWYRRAFEVPAGWCGGVVRLRFGAVDYYAEIWLNGERLGDHEGGYLPFAFEIQDRLADDRPNELILRVLDPGRDTEETFPRYRFAEIPHGKQSWYGPIGGIWQSVILERRGASYVRDLRLTPSVSAERVAVACEVQHPADGQLVVRVYAPNDALVGETTLPTTPDRRAYEASVAVPRPELWDLDHPALYRAEVELSVASGVARWPHPHAPSPSEMARRSVGQQPWPETPLSTSGGEKVPPGEGGQGVDPGVRPPADRYADTFGFRTIEARDGEILLNGRPIYLRGALDQAYYPGTFYTIPSEEFLRDRFRKAKELGLNCLRCHIKVEDPLYYRLADEMGLLIWTELPNWGSRGPESHRRTPLASERARKTIEGMIRRDWNHPSIVCWTIVNENWGPDVVESAADRAWLRDTFDAVKALDPHRLVVDNSACRPNFHVKSDLDDYHFYYAIPDHAERWSATVADFASRPPWSYSPHGDAIRTGQEPLIVSEFGNWGLPNMNDLIEADGTEPWWFDTGAEWGGGRTRGIVHPKGVQDRFVALGLDRIFGSYQAFIAASQEQQHEALAYEIEELRRHDSIKGYVITELTDVHWECNGLLGLGNTPKSFHHRLAAVNADDVIVSRLSPDSRRAFWGGECLAIDHVISRFSRRDVEGTTFRWWSEIGRSGGSIHGLGSQQLPWGRACAIRGANITLPEVARPERIRLYAELLDSNGSAIARNHLDTFVFPTALRRARVQRAVHVVGPVGRVAGLAARLGEMGYRVVDDWRQADLVVGLGFDDALRSIVRDGARALGLVDDASLATTGLGPLEIVERQGSGYEGDWASSFSWLDASRLNHRVPSGPRLDWAFATVIPDQVILGLDAAAIGRDGLAGMFLGWIQKPAALALQANLGRGKLLLTTLRLANPKGEPLGADPVATVLFQDFVEHACSGRWTPTLALE